MSTSPSGARIEVGFPDPVLYVDGEISGSIKLAGITLAGVTVGINFDGITGRLSARVTVASALFPASKTFTIGYLAVPPPVFLASLASEFNTQTGQVINPDLGDARANIAARHLWDNAHLANDGDGTLYLNIGTAPTCEVSMASRPVNPIGTTRTNTSSSSISTTCRRTARSSPGGNRNGQDHCARPNPNFPRGKEDRGAGCGTR